MNKEEYIYSYEELLDLVIKYQNENYKIKKYYTIIEQENQQLKERIDKAIEYMEESMSNPFKYEWAVLKHTLEILKGDTNE